MSEEQSAWVPPDLDEYDVAAVTGILIRVMRIDNANRTDKALLEELTKAIAARSSERTKYVSGIGAFGFPMSGEDVWKRVRSGIGDKAYDQAIRIARQPPKLSESQQALLPSSEKSGGVDSEIEGEQEGMSEEAEREIPKVRDAILAYLRSLPEGSGAQVPAIREHLSEQYQMEMHEKTPGMTLYRLSKDDLVRRDGRTWYAITNKDQQDQQTKPGNG